MVAGQLDELGYRRVRRFLGPVACEGRVESLKVVSHVSDRFYRHLIPVLRPA